MTFRRDFGFLLADDANIADVASTDIYYLQLPQGIRRAALLYQQVSNRREDSLRGNSRIRHARMQIDAFSPDPDECETLARHVRALLDGNTITRVTTLSLNFVTQTYTMNGTVIGAAWLESETDLYEEAVKLYRITADYEVAYWSVTP